MGEQKDEEHGIKRVRRVLGDVKKRKSGKKREMGGEE